MKLILVRYGEHENGHLNDVGKQSMILVGKKLKPIIERKNISIICAKIPRAIESAEIISKNLGILSVKDFTELYASEESSINLEKALEIINSVGVGSDIVIAIISREYIEALPGYILGKEIDKLSVSRGEFLMLDYDKKDIIKL